MSVGTSFALHRLPRAQTLTSQEPELMGTGTSSPRGIGGPSGRTRAEVAVWVALVGLVLPEALPAASTNLPSDISLWDHSVSARTAVGYNDNLLLSDLFRQESPLLSVGLDASLWRLPRDGNELYLFFMGEYTQYLPDREPENEQLLYLVGQGRRQLSDHWKAGLQLKSVYQYNVFDASTTETNLVPLPVRGYLVGGLPEIRRDLGKQWRVEVGAEVDRQFFDGQLDDYWQAGPGMTLGKDYGHRSMIEFSYGYEWRSYDERSPLRDDGSSEAGQTLVYAIQEVEVSSRHHFDPQRRWRLNSKLGLGLNQDNGSGYYDFARYHLNEQVRYTHRGLTIEGQTRLRYYDYSEQTATGLSGDPRRYVVYLQLGIRVEKALGPNLSVFVEYDHDWNWSNRAINEYIANRLRSGVEWTL
jgi:hypothetical protein